MSVIDGRVVLITGGTGSFGKAFIRYVLENYSPKKLIVFSRDEFKQWQMQRSFPNDRYPQLRYFLGDIRDKDRLRLAFDGVDFVIHAAALKHVPMLEYNPFEAVKTNIIGAQNIIEVAIEKGVKKVVALSTDKAVNPVNLYGATKLTMEKLFVAGNAYSGAKETSFSIVRYGNVVGSRGSVIPLFMEFVENGCKELPITDERMTRFWITLNEGVRLVLFALEESVGGEIFVPKLPSVRVVDIARAICPDCTFKFVGIRPGEKLHETLIAEDEARDVRVVEHKGRKYFVLLPYFAFESKRFGKWREYEKLPEGFVYRSDLNDWWLSDDELVNLIKECKVDAYQ